MALRIPDNQLDALAQLLQLSDDVWTALLEAIQKVKPTLSVISYVEQLASELGEEVEDARAVIQFLISLFAVRERLSDSPEEFFRDLREAAANSRKPELNLDDKAWEKLSEHLTKLFGTESSIELSAKAQTLLYDTERVFTDARIITDLRPVFRTDVEQHPEAMLITHTLRIDFQDDQELKDIYVALDFEELTKLRGIVSRALEKDKSLQSLLKDKGITYIGMDRKENS